MSVLNVNIRRYIMQESNDKYVYDIPYENDGKIMKTPCPCTIGAIIPMVGSGLCRCCASFKHKDDELKVVRCIASNIRKREFVGNKHYLVYVPQNSSNNKHKSMDEYIREANGMAEKVDFLNKEERILYESVLVDAMLWGDGRKN